MKKSVLMTTAMAAVLGVAAGAASAQEIRFMCYSDGNECEVYDDVLTRFEAENPGIDVIVDVVPYQAILENLCSWQPAPARISRRSPTLAA